MSIAAGSTPSLTANIFHRPPLSNKKFQVAFIHERELYSSTDSLNTFLKSASSPSAPFGLAGAYVPCDEKSMRDGTACLLTKIAVATPDAVLVITLHFLDDNNPSDVVDHTVLYETLFNTINPLAFVGFNMDRLALQLFGEYGLEIRNAVDIFSIKIPSLDSPRGGKEFMKFVKGDLDMTLATAMLNNEEDKPKNDTTLAMRAWVGAVLDQASEALALSLAAAAPVNVSLRSKEELIELKKTLLSSDRLRGSASDFQRHEVQIERTGGKLFLISQQYNTRVRRSDYDFELVFENETFNTRIKGVKGRRAELIIPQSINLEAAGELMKAETLGKEEATILDNQRSNFILFALQGKISISDNPLLRQIWFPEDGPVKQPLDVPELKGEEFKRLNNSQRQAVEDMLLDSADPRIVLVHGPPGTGKTSVIAAMTECILCADEEPPSEIVPNRLSMDSTEEKQFLPDPILGPTVWIVAQSNVAVKNVAEKLVKVGIERFKLIVSREFYYDWHEHVYTKVKERMVVTSALPKNQAEVRAFLGETRVVLCTLSMVTSPLLSKLDFHKYIPVNNVVVDEASQIQLGDLLPLLHLHSAEIKRLCLVGDHHQLAPYGQEEVQEIESIFEKEHIVEKAVFLKITYRLPKPISNIISSEVYRSQLIPYSEESRSTCCKWFDIAGKEEEEGTSHYNSLEIDACILLAKELEAKKKDYRIISPYATQTSKVMARMKEEKMDWEDKCFNVDSFQGNEADYIIITLVRTEAMGFLQNSRRANVLLTRCKKGMFVMTSRELMMKERSRETLLGKFAFTWDASQEKRSWPTFKDLEEGREMVDEELFNASSATSPLSKAASRKAARAEKAGSRLSGGTKPVEHKGKGKEKRSERT